MFHLLDLEFSDLTPPTQEEMALFLLAANGLSFHPCSARVAAWLIHQSTHAKEVVDQLRALLVDAGLPMDTASAFEATSLAKAVDRLLAAKVVSDPILFLDPTSDQGIDRHKLLCLLEARIRRSDGDPTALAALAESLRRA
jgi:hypothetical protein